MGHRKNLDAGAGAAEVSDKRLPLLPDGEAAIARTGELSIKTGEKTRRVISFEISGLGLRLIPSGLTKITPSLLPSAVGCLSSATVGNRCTSFVKEAGRDGSGSHSPARTDFGESQTRR